MFFFKKAKRLPILKTKVRQDILERLQEFLDKETGEPIEILCGFWKDQEEALTYQELREAIIQGDLNEKVLDDWQQDYSVMVSKYMKDWWQKAIVAGATGQAIFTELGQRGYQFDFYSSKVMEYIQHHGAQFVTRVIMEQKEAIKGLLTKAVIERYGTDELARVIRPCVGLYQGQTVANLKYYDHVKATLKKEHPRMKDTTVEKKAREAAAKYAEKQHRYRAQMIAQTEMAYAYNYGAEAAAQEAFQRGFLGSFKRIWCTSGGGNICTECDGLDGTEVKEIMIPPLHPHCNCVIQYVEKEKPQRYLFPSEEGKPLATFTNDKEERKPLITFANDKNVAIIKEKMLQQAQSISKEGKQVIKTYSGFGAQRINQAIATGKINAKVEKEILLLDQALKDMVVPENIIVYRKTYIEFIENLYGSPIRTQQELQYFKNAIMNNQIFTSTSWKLLDLPKRNVYLALHVPKGYRGAAYIKELVHKKYQVQEEILLKREMKYRVVSVKLEGGIYYIEGEVLY